MQLVHGRSLAEVIEREGAIPWARATGLAAQVADALAAAHAAGIIHRDLKPENILLEPRDDGSELVKVLDFGIASVSMDDGPAPEGAAPKRALTRVGMVMGTPGYMAPEQAMGEKVDERADLYSLGVILWESAMGTELFPGTELPAIVHRQLTEPAPSLADVGGPPELTALVARLLAREPSGRPESASAVRDALRQMTWRTSAAGPITGALPRVDPVSGELALALIDEQAPGPSPERAPTILATAQPDPRHKALLIAAAVASAAIVLLIGLSLGLYFMFSDGGPERPGVITQARRAAEPEMSRAVQVKIDRMVQGHGQNTRRSAARWLSRHEPVEEVPAWSRAVAGLEIARGCRTRREALRKIRDLGDVRALPSVERYHHAPHRGCGLLRQSDCYGCVRDDLRQTVEALGGDPDAE
jgi:serine/threonine-protein kinase